MQSHHLRLQHLVSILLAGLLLWWVWWPGWIHGTSHPAAEPPFKVWGIGPQEAMAMYCTYA